MGNYKENIEKLEKELQEIQIYGIRKLHFVI